MEWTLIKLMLFISTHKIEERYWKYWRETLEQKTETMQPFITHFMSSQSWYVQTSPCKCTLQFLVFVEP